MVAEQRLYAEDPGGEIGVAELKEDDARVRQPTAEDQLDEVLVLGEEDASVRVREGEDLGIRQTGRVMPAHADGVVAQCLEIGDEPGADILIEQEPHACAARAGASGFGVGGGCWPATAACA